MESLPRATTSDLLILHSRRMLLVVTADTHRTFSQQNGGEWNSRQVFWRSERKAESWVEPEYAEMFSPSAEKHAQKAGKQPRSLPGGMGRVLATMRA